jgi:hypothetical protein
MERRWKVRHLSGGHINSVGPYFHSYPYCSFPSEDQYGASQSLPQLQILLQSSMPALKFFKFQSHCTSMQHLLISKWLGGEYG